MNKIIILAVSLMLNAVPLSAAASPMNPVISGQGLPLPWPFPWAKECPVKWEAIQGRYSMSESIDHEEIELKVTFVQKFGISLVRVARLSNEHVVLSEGIAMIHQGQRSIRLRLEANEPGEPIIWAAIKFYYGGRELLCDDSYLVPILTLEKEGWPVNQRTEYRLIKEDGN